MPEYLTGAVNELNQILRTAEKQRQAQEKADLISDMVHWSYIDTQGNDSTTIEYPSFINTLLEEAYRRDDTLAKFRDNKGNPFVVNITDMEEYPEDNPGSAVKVIRRSNMDSKYKEGNDLLSFEHRLKAV